MRNSRDIKQIIVEAFYLRWKWVSFRHTYWNSGKTIVRDSLKIRYIEIKILPFILIKLSMHKGVWISMLQILYLTIRHISLPVKNLVKAAELWPKSTLIRKKISLWKWKQLTQPTPFLNCNSQYRLMLFAGQNFLSMEI